jgi:predicted aconitase
MYLTDKQKRMLAGEYGEPVRIAMEMLNALGEVYGAEKMIPVRKAHCAGLSLKSHGIAGMEWAEDMVRKGAKVVIPTTMNVIGVDRSRDLKLPSKWVENQMRIQRAYEAMGCIGTSSCVPYYFSFLPHFGEHIAWAESSAVVFVNSVLGARDNREGGPSAWAAGITGLTPFYGLHLDRNRRGDILFKVNVELKDLADYGALGNYVGSMIGEKIPVFEHLGQPTTEQMVYFGAALASAGGVAMYHILGLTPEAQDIKGVFGGKKYETVELGKEELEQGYINLNNSKRRDVDYVALGCPHCSLNQIRDIAKMLDGKRVKEGVTLWIHTNIPIKQMAINFGYAKIIEDAGGIITQDLCTILGDPEDLGFKTLATHSAKMAFYAPGNNGFDVWYGSEEQCIKAALTGRWDF